jgi:hypothetical protein
MEGGARRRLERSRPLTLSLQMPALLARSARRQRDRCQAGTWQHATPLRRTNLLHKRRGAVATREGVVTLNTSGRSRGSPTPEPCVLAVAAEGLVRRNSSALEFLTLGRKWRLHTGPHKAERLSIHSGFHTTNSAQHSHNSNSLRTTALSATTRAGVDNVPDGETDSGCGGFVAQQRPSR